MTRIPVRHHTSVVILPSRQGNEFVFNIYDETYPRVFYRGAVNFVGGNLDPRDISPRGLLERELMEEFAVKEGGDLNMDKDLQDLHGDAPGAMVGSFAPREEITSVRNQIVNTLKPYMDCFVSVPSMEGKPGFDMTKSYYVSDLDEEAFYLIKRNLKEGKSLVNGGFLTVTSTEDIASEKVQCAWDTGLIMMRFLNLNRPLKNPFGIAFQEIGMPRELMSDYFCEYSYKALGQ